MTTGITAAANAALLSVTAPFSLSATSAVAPTAPATVENPHEVRDPARAQYWLDQIKADVLARYPNLDAAVAAGYGATSDYNGPLHYTQGGYTNPDPNHPDGGTQDFSSPFSLMVENGEIVGVMLRAPAGEVDLGAGVWHNHGEAGDAPLMHVWFNKPLDQSFGGHVPGFMPNDPTPSPNPSPSPSPSPDPMPMPMPMPMPVPSPAPTPTPAPMPMPMPGPSPQPSPKPVSCSCGAPTASADDSKSGVALIS